MLQETSISDILSDKVGVDSHVTVHGWVKTRRDSKAGFSFIMLNDGSCFDSIQIIAPNSLNNYVNEILHLTAGCSIEATGKLVKSPGKGQSFEIQADNIKVLGFVEDPETYPISPKHHTLEYLREYAHLRPRTNTFGAVARVRDCLAQAIHRFFHENGFYWVHTPLITTSDCEGAGEMFRVSTLDLLNIPKTEKGTVDFAEDFFGKEAFLTVSGQLNVESYCCALSKVYTFGPAFRAEKSFTTRHLAELWMVEPEIAFADIKDNAKLAESLLKYTCKALLDERSDDMAFFQKHIESDCISRIEHIINQSFELMEYTDAIKALKKSGKKFEFPVKWGMDLQSEHERYLAEELVKRPVVVMNYPKEIKSFYMRLNDDGKTVAAMDILVSGMGELIGGSQREERLDILDQRINELGLDKDSYWWYRDLRQYGTVPHSGFGLGFDRYVCYVTGIANIRDSIPFPRTTKQADF